MDFVLNYASAFRSDTSGSVCTDKMKPPWEDQALLTQPPRLERGPCDTVITAPLWTDLALAV